MKKISSLIIFICTLQFGYTQSFDSALGVRLGTGWGMTYAHRIAKKVTAEAILTSSFQRNETTITALVRQHYPLITKRFNVYSGGGLHFGWINDGDTMHKGPFGITGIVGAGFTIARMNISWDFRPSLNLSGGERTFYAHTGVAVRYVLIKRKIKLFGGKNRKKRNKKNKDKKFNWKFWE